MCVYVYVCVCVCACVCVCCACACVLHVLHACYCHYHMFFRHDEAKIRKSYFKMAQKYHPDKNPDGRDIFEAVNKAVRVLVLKII